MGTQPQFHCAAPPIERLFQTSLFALITTGFVTLASTGKLDLPAIVAVVVALAFRGYSLAVGRKYRLPEQLTSYLGLLYFALYFVDFFLFSRSFVTATIHLVLFGMVVKIFSVQRERDYVYLATLAFLEVLSAAILTIDSVFFIAFSVFALVAVVTFITLEMRRSSARATKTADASPQNSRKSRAPRGRFARAVAWTSVAIVAAMMLAASMIFFVLPRFSYPFLGRFARQNAMVSGFSDDVNLGAIGRIQQSSEIVAHVSVDGDKAGRHESALYLRGAALSVFDGHRWTNPSRFPIPLQNSPGGRVPLTQQIFGASAIDDVAPPLHRQIISYHVTLEPFGTNVVFVIPQALFIGGGFRAIGIDRDGALTHSDRDRSLGEYNGISEIAAPLPDSLRDTNSELPPDMPRRYVQLPNSLDTRIARLAHQLGDDQPTAYDKASAIERYLTTQFGYTLELPSEMPEDPLADFLFHRKRGHCEFFASSMAILLRELGIPTRVLTGFRGGEFNQLTGSYIVRARDAHAWVEAYIPAHGWVTFDPTPASDAVPMTITRRFDLYMDAAREFWREWVIDYDPGRQQNLGQQTAVTTRNRLVELRRWTERVYAKLQNYARALHREASGKPQRVLMIAFFVALAIALLVSAPKIFMAMRRHMLARDPKRRPHSAAGIWYTRMLRLAERRGYPRDPAQTPQEFASSIDHEPMRALVSEFTTRYERARFNESAEDASELPSLYEKIAANK